MPGEPPDHFDEPDDFPDGDELPDDPADADDIDIFEMNDDEVDGDINDFASAEWLLVNLDTAEKRDLVVDIVGHPQNAPSMDELAYTNPSMSSEMVERHLGELVDADIVRCLDASYNTGDVGVDDPPQKFYVLTDGARRGVEAADRFPREAWTRQYASVRKTNRIKILESLPRPDTE